MVLSSLFKTILLSVSCVNGINTEGVRSNSSTDYDRTPSRAVVNVNSNGYEDLIYNGEYYNYGYYNHDGILNNLSNNDRAAYFVDLFEDNELINDLYLTFYNYDYGKTYYLNYKCYLRFDYNEDVVDFCTQFGGAVRVLFSFNYYDNIYISSSNEYVLNIDGLDYYYYDKVVILGDYPSNVTKGFYDLFYTTYSNLGFTYSFGDLFNPYGWLGYDNSYYVPSVFGDGSASVEHCYFTALNGVFVDSSGNLFSGIVEWFNLVFNSTYPNGATISGDLNGLYMELDKFYYLGLPKINGGYTNYRTVEVCRQNRDMSNPSSWTHTLDYTWLNDTYKSIRVLYYVNDGIASDSADTSNINNQYVTRLIIDDYIQPSNNRVDVLLTYSTDGYGRGSGGGFGGIGNVTSIINIGLSGLLGLFNSYLLPGISIGLLVFLPLIMSLVLFIIKLFKR